MKNPILIENVISAVGAVCMFISCYAKSNKRTYFFLGLQNIILAISSIVFGSYSAVTTMLISALRNYLLIKGTFTKKRMLLFAVLIVFLGLVFNTKGMLGLIPVFASVQITVCHCLFKSPAATKLAFAINLYIWTVYAFIIQDYSSGFSWGFNGTVALFACISILRSTKNKTKELK